MSIVLRTVLAVLVLMPPGAYRSLQVLSHPLKGQPSLACRSRVKRSHLPIVRPATVLSYHSSIPPRARTWCQTTFTCQRDVESEPLGWADTPALWILIFANLDPAHRALKRCPAAQEMRSPRAAILALHELLI